MNMGMMIIKEHLIHIDSFAFLFIRLKAKRTEVISFKCEQGHKLIVSHIRLLFLIVRVRTQ